MTFTDSSTQSSDSDEGASDRIHKFLNPEVQLLLKTLTGQDLPRIFRKRKVGQKLREPKYSFMTEKQLEETIKETREKADKLIQMPPVVPPRKPVETILSFDPRIQGHDDSVYVLTDISMNVKNKVRVISPGLNVITSKFHDRANINPNYLPQFPRIVLSLYGI